ncbi:hypothetical protein AAG589_16145 [Isoptericola sp. F-RaC21]|uniref:hypothetical protein n=1 Tax=Isoptericola sp. F-RaC21 TaxID=3141452 RepID=UPI00315BBB7F
MLNRAAQLAGPEAIRSGRGVTHRDVRVLEEAAWHALDTDVGTPAGPRYFKGWEVLADALGYDVPAEPDRTDQSDEARAARRRRKNQRNEISTSVRRLNDAELVDVVGVAYTGRNAEFRVLPRLMPTDVGRLTRRQGRRRPTGETPDLWTTGETPDHSKGETPDQSDPTDGRNARPVDGRNARPVTGETPVAGRAKRPTQGKDEEEQIGKTGQESTYPPAPPSSARARARATAATTTAPASASSARCRVHPSRPGSGCVDCAGDHRDPDGGHDVSPEPACRYCSGGAS